MRLDEVVSDGLDRAFREISMLMTKWAPERFRPSTISDRIISGQWSIGGSTRRIDVEMDRKGDQIIVYTMNLDDSELKDIGNALKAWPDFRRKTRDLWKVFKVRPK